jgi:hypothetical protein
LKNKVYKNPIRWRAYGMKEGLKTEKQQYVVDLVEMVDSADF